MRRNVAKLVNTDILILDSAVINLASVSGLRSLFSTCLILSLFTAWIGCGQVGAKHQYFYVAAPEAVLRDRIAAVYNKTGTLHNGEKVEVLERLPNRRFVRVRSVRGEEGWVQERYLTDQQTYDQFQRLEQQFKDSPMQAVAETRKEVNLHPTPGRKTEHLYQLKENEKVELLQRQTVDKNADPGPKPASDGKESESKENEPAEAGDEAGSKKPGVAPEPEDWWLIRDSQKRVGWVLGRMLYVDVPIEIGQYAEGHRVVAFYVLDQVQDGDNKIDEYLTLLSENKDGLPYDYDQARVFTWNLRRHRYETAYRSGSLSGFLPATLGRENFGKEGELRTFTLNLADDAGKLHAQEYKFNPPIVRQVLAPGETPLPRSRHSGAKHPS